ncbi:hypothetical protein WN59_10360 [Salinicoccus sediminis]|uniref:HTH marR-type domain-containing protein n=1 Tax=Salinicoccus sediminis TaxID=1432562 RepID=A0A0M2SMA1_9STAP|nr:MarR family transcriptional regulator [Salinicoccus sediminis]KKK33992.1 hypothetical protein WN59_10360 [Salinicoccus sediminis]
MSVTAKTNTRNVCRYIYLLNAKIDHLAEFETEKGNLTRDQLYIIEMIAEEPGITQKLLVERFKKKQTSVSRAITRLDERGFIQKEPDPADKRATHLDLTDLGERTLVNLEDAICELSDQIVSELDEEEKEVFIKALEKIHL